MSPKNEKLKSNEGKPEILILLDHIDSKELRSYLKKYKLILGRVVRYTNDKYALIITNPDFDMGSFTPESPLGSACIYVESNYEQGARMWTVNIELDDGELCIEQVGIDSSLSYELIRYIRKDLRKTLKLKKKK